MDATRVWFGCDVGKWSQRPGILDPEIYDFELSMGWTSPRSKAGRSHEHTDRGDDTHAMVATGVDRTISGTPPSGGWKNSWGPKKVIKDICDEYYWF